jgi:hypothetical protein
MADRKSKEELNNVVDEITMDAYNDDEQLLAFRQALEDEVALPAEASLIGDPVEVLTIDYDGNERRGLTARCRRHGSVYTVAAQDLAFPDGSNAAHLIAAYLLWLGVEPYPYVKKWPKAFEDELDIRKSIELVALAVEKGAVSCRILEKDYALTLRPSKYLEIVLGEIITVSPRKKWHHGGRLCLAGEIIASRTDIPALFTLCLSGSARWECGTPGNATGENPMSRKNHGPGPSSSGAYGPSTKWSRCFPARTPTTPTRTRSLKP